jgi:hypothetical protein
MIDLVRYQRLKPKGLTWIEKGEETFLKFKRFSVEDGTEIVDEPEIWLVERDKIEQDRERAVKLISATDEFLKDLDSL